MTGEDGNVIVDERTYTIAPGRLDAYLEMHLREALPIMRRHLGEPVGYFVTETGTLNQFVHLWPYSSMAEREQRRTAMYADPHWLAYRQRIGDTGWILKQENRIIRMIAIAER
jgi:hypothetical protein